jgi:outer membrane lipoprotein-sorting protein
MIPTSLMLIWSLAAKADSTGDAWLDRIDAAAQVDDVHLVLTLQASDGKGGSSTRTIEVWQKGADHRLVRLTEPARLRGVGLLVEGTDSLYLFLPQYPPARKVTGSKRSDAFLGTDFSVDDLARINYQPDYSAVVAGTEVVAGSTLTRLVLTPERETGSSKVQLWVDNDNVVRRVEHSDSKGVVTRRMTLDDVKVHGRVRLAHALKVEDLTRGKVTVATLTTVEVDQGVSDELFTVTNLERP